LGTYTNEPPDQTALFSAANLLSSGGHDGREILPEEFRILLEALIGAHEDHADLRQLLTDAVVDDLGVVLRTDARQELAFGFRDAEALEVFLIFSGTSSQDFSSPWTACGSKTIFVHVDLHQIAAHMGIGRER